MSCQVKICGLTSGAEAERALAAGADALGINLWPGSKRHVPLAECGWLEALRGRVARVAVAVDPTEEEVERIWSSGWFDWVQLHGGEGEEFVIRLTGAGVAVIKALRVRDRAVLDEAAAWLDRGVTVLLDAYHAGIPGGTGQAWDWTLAAKFAAGQRGRRWILSGGLNSENVSDACAIVQPPAVDVASGVERAGDPRHKEPSLLSRFIHRVRGVAIGSDTNPRIF